MRRGSIQYDAVADPSELNLISCPNTKVGKQPHPLTCWVYSARLQVAGYLYRERRIAIGRDASLCNLVLEHAVISKLHAVIEIDEEQRVTISDLGSRNGTFVNDEIIARRELKNGDKVGFGPGGIVAFTYHEGAQQSHSVPASHLPQPAAETLQRFAIG